MKNIQTYLEQLVENPEDADLRRLFGPPHRMGDEVHIPVFHARYGPQGMAHRTPLADIAVTAGGTEVKPVRDENALVAAAVVLAGWVFAWAALAAWFIKRD